MKMEIETIQYDSSRMLYWTRINLKREENQTLIYACISREHLDDFYQGGIKNWQEKVSKKWIANETMLREDFFNLPIHYDIYANTPEGESNGLDFLVSQA